MYSYLGYRRHIPTNSRAPAYFRAACTTSMIRPTTLGSDSYRSGQPLVSILQNNGKKTYSRNVTQAVLLTTEDLAQNAAHDLAAAGLGKVVDDEDRLGGGERSDRPADLHHEVLADLLAGIVAVLEGNERVDGLAGQLVRNTHDSSFGNRG